MSRKVRTQLAHASTSLHLFNELFRFFEADAGCLPVKLYRLNFSIARSAFTISSDTWLPWLERESGWSDSTALRYMQDRGRVLQNAAHRTLVERHRLNRSRRKSPTAPL